VRGTIFDAIYPVGSIYLSYNHVSPGTLFGGTWARIENAFLWASSASDTIGVTGGEKTHVLTANEMPTHKHQIAAYKSTDGAGVQVDAYSALAGSSTGSDTTSKYYTNGSQSVGGSQAHNNMPPYIQVSVWRRTA
jgi:microcystin-dependent protein